MADPTVTLLTSGGNTTATTNVTFSAQAAGTLLFLGVCADDYRTTSGSGRPESTGWTLMESQQYNAGFYTWWKIASGSETSVDYTLNNALRSSYAVITATNIDSSPFGSSSSNVDTGSAVTSKATPSITPTAGSRWLVFACIGSPRYSGAGCTVSAWSNSYTEIADVVTGSGTTENIAVAYLILDGGAATSTTATVTGPAVQCGAAIGAFKVAAAGSNFSPPFHRNPSRGLILRGRR